jgi:hypothetical protein
MEMPVGEQKGFMEELSNGNAPNLRIGFFIWANSAIVRARFSRD